MRLVKKFEDITEITVLPSDKAIIDNVDDILIELVDIGFEPEVGVAEYDDDFGDIYAGPYCHELDKRGLLVDINITSNMRWDEGTLYNYFEYNQISEYILTIIDFMKLNWGYIEVVYLYNIDSGYQRHRKAPKQEQKLQRFTLLIKKNKKPGMIRRFMKKFEAFSMKVDVCPRCGESTNNQTTMSVFNTDVICLPCKDREKDDPDYQLAVDTEAEEVRKGNYNYPGIYPNYKPLD